MKEASRLTAELRGSGRYVDLASYPIAADFASACNTHAASIVASCVPAGTTVPTLDDARKLIPRLLNAPSVTRRQTSKLQRLQQELAALHAVRAAFTAALRQKKDIRELRSVEASRPQRRSRRRRRPRATSLLENVGAVTHCRDCGRIAVFGSDRCYSCGGGD